MGKKIDQAASMESFPPQKSKEKKGNAGTVLGGGPVGKERNQNFPGTRKETRGSQGRISLEKGYKFEPQSGRSSNRKRKTALGEKGGGNE